MASMSVREQNVFKAKLAEQAERYDEMAAAMKTVAEMDAELSTDDRNLLSVAYKNAVGSRRSSWRIVSSIETREIESGKEDRVKRCADFRADIENELRDLSKDILTLIDDYIIPKSSTSESKVFYHKMKGDYYRYIAEFSTGDDREIAANSAHDAYEEATTIAKADLPITHPIRLGLALNFSVFHYEVLNKQDKACNMAQDAFEGAVAQLDHVDEETYKESTLIMQLLRDNLTLWVTEDDADV